MVQSYADRVLDYDRQNVTHRATEDDRGYFAGLRNAGYANHYHTRSANTVTIVTVINMVEEKQKPCDQLSFKGLIQQ